MVDPLKKIRNNSPREDPDSIIGFQSQRYLPGYSHILASARKIQDCEALFPKVSPDNCKIRYPATSRKKQRNTSSDMQIEKHHKNIGNINLKLGPTLSIEKFEKSDKKK